jgi:hypothetical protein
MQMTVIAAVGCAAGTKRIKSYADDNIKYEVDGERQWRETDVGACHGEEGVSSFTGDCLIRT